MSKIKLSVIISLRENKGQHRDAKRLDDCLTSLDNQTAKGEFEVIISDTDSSPAFKKSHAAAANKHKAKYLYSRTGQPWNISLARNAGVRAARGQYVMTFDMDCIVAPDYIETALRHAAPDTIISCHLSELPEGYDGPLDEWQALKAVALPCSDCSYGANTIVDRRWLESVHGWDEKYILWGAEDTDLVERAKISGKALVWIDGETSNFHQWHSQANRKSDPEQLKKNRARFALTAERKLPLVRNPHTWGGKPEPDEWDDTAIIVTAFERNDSLLRTIRTIRRFYPTIDVIIADNGHPSDKKTQWADDYDCRLVTVPFDSGVTATRNAGVRALLPRHKFVVIAEDDIAFMSESDLAKWRLALGAEPGAGVAGGKLLVVTMGGGETVQSYEATLEIDEPGRTVYLRSIENPKWKTIRATGMRYYFADIVLNVFMARRETLDALPWDENIKSAPEHCDWFFMLKFRAPAAIPNKVVFVPDVVLVHHKDITTLLDENYQAYRGRPGAFEYFGKKWNVDYYWSSWHPKWGIDNPKPLASYVNTNLQTRRNVFTSAAKILDLMGVKWWLEAGTCLGAIREQNFIGHDLDIDVGIWTDTPTAVADDLERRMKAVNFDTYHRWEYGGKLTEISFVKAEVKVDVFFFFERGGLAWHGAYGPEKDNGTGGFTKFLPHVFSLSLFRELRPIEFVGLRVKVPSPPEQYLMERYGPDWRTPKKDYRYWMDCRAVARKFLEPEKATAYIGGVWDVFHHGHLNILERCKQLAGRLVVGVLTDDAAAAYKPRPLIPEAERLRIIRSLRIVDDAILQRAQDPTGDLQQHEIKPDYLIHGDDWDFVPGADYVRANGGRAMILPHTRDISSTIIKASGGAGVAAEVKPPEVRSIVLKLGRPVKKIEPIAIGIKTFMRASLLYRTIAAIEKHVTIPHRLYIADDGPIDDEKRWRYQRLVNAGHVVIELPSNSGISVGRNAIAKAVTESRVLIQDDDIGPTDADCIPRMMAVLDAAPTVGVVAALIKGEAGEFFASEGYAKGLTLDLAPPLLTRTPAPRHVERVGEDGPMYVRADQVPNFFIARKEALDAVKWDNEIRVEYEHIDWFLGLMKTPWKAAVCLDAHATHWNAKSERDYFTFRNSQSPAHFNGKWGIARIVNQWK